jgi:hypothetical protein
MIVKELIEILEQEDLSRVVVLSRDQEGNGFGECSGFSTQSYSDGEIGLEKLTDELRKQGYSEEDVRDGKPALVLWP